MDEFPRLYRFFETDSTVSGKEKRLEKSLKIIENKYTNLLNSARQIFSIAVHTVQELETKASPSA